MAVREDDAFRKGLDPSCAPQPSGGVRRRLSYWIAGILGLAIIIAGAAAGPVMSRVETPDYQVESSAGPIEVRSYGPMIAAEAVVAGERRAAISEGFRLIAAYIFGANKPNARIAMTAPVQQQKQTIAMTAPVTQQRAGQGPGDTWTVRFIMPKSWTMATLPAPTDARVSLKQIPARRYVAITFSGLATSKAIAQRTDELRRYATEHRLPTTGEPLLAFYNPPWTLPFLRRNEVMLELSDIQH
ncbi:SOUL family heme-binding protein [Bradyrhizobium sp.]|uniref:SOUL family heme-binding protein n=1 Tax=Bradyrhizobium sp. TaxID=376 RepID=UPI003C3A1744